MYREDVDQLMALFEQGCKIVVISDDKYRYDSFDEMKAKSGPRIKNLDIRGENPGVRFLFNQTEVLRVGNPPLQSVYNELRTEELTDAADGVFYKIKDFVAAYQRPGFIKLWIVPTVVGLFGTFWFAIHNSQQNENGQATLGSLPGVLISMLVFTISFALGMGRGNFLSLETRRNSASFFVRNREDFAKHAISSLISAVIGLIIGYVLGRFIK
jgi:hypothetical protein